MVENIVANRIGEWIGPYKTVKTEGDKKMVYLKTETGEPVYIHLI